jgi:hypothetical protein
MKFIVLVLIIIGVLTSKSEGLYLKINPTTRSLEEIDLTTYFLSTTPRTNYGAWPNLKNSDYQTIFCDSEVDVQFSSFTGLYSVQDWFRSEHDYGKDGGILFQFNIIDLQSFVNLCFQVGVWQDPQNCNNVWSEMKDKFIIPVISRLGTFGSEPIVVEENGLHFELLCKTKDDVIRQQYCQSHGNYGCSVEEILGYRKCTAATFLQIQQSKNPQNIQYMG